MALVKCTECGREISDRALSCPACGAPVSAATPNEVTPAASPSGAAGRGTGSALGIAAVVLGLGAVVMPYFAAVFLVPAALICGLIAFKRGQKGLGGTGVVLAMIGLLGIIYVSQEINRIVKDPFAPSSIGRSEAPVVTLAEYEQVREGMTYEQVRSIIGTPGQELSRSDLAGYTTVMYSWSNPNGSNMNAMFQNGRLVNKAQFGLR